MAEKSSLNPDDKFADISWEKRSEIPIVLAAADIGYILYITN